MGRGRQIEGWQEKGWPRYRNSHRALLGEDVHRLCPGARHIRVTSTFSSLPQASLPASLTSSRLLQMRTGLNQPSLSFHPFATLGSFTHCSIVSSRSQSLSIRDQRCCPSFLFSFREKRQPHEATCGRKSRRVNDVATSS